MGTNYLGMESLLLHYTISVGTYSWSTVACTSQHTNVAEKAILFCHMGSSEMEFLAQLSYKGQREVRATFPYRTNGMSGISQDAEQKRGVATDDWTSGCIRALQ